MHISLFIVLGVAVFVLFVISGHCLKSISSFHPEICYYNTLSTHVKQRNICGGSMTVHHSSRTLCNRLRRVLQQSLKDRVQSRQAVDKLLSPQDKGIQTSANAIKWMGIFGRTHLRPQRIEQVVDRRPCFEPQSLSSRCISRHRSTGRLHILNAIQGEP